MGFATKKQFGIRQTSSPVEYVLVECKNGDRAVICTDYLEEFEKDYKTAKIIGRGTYKDMEDRRTQSTSEMRSPLIRTRYTEWRDSLGNGKPKLFGSMDFRVHQEPRLIDGAVWYQFEIFRWIECKGKPAPGKVEKRGRSKYPDRLRERAIGFIPVPDDVKVDIRELRQQLGQRRSVV